MTNERTDTGHVSYRLEVTHPNVVLECHSPDCEEHYVVRLDGTWVRGFHDEAEAHTFAEDMRSLVNA